MSNLSQKKNIPFQQVLAALLDDQSVFPPAYLHQFSDLEGKEFTAFESVWHQVKPNRRFALLEDLEEVAENDTLVLFDNIARLALKDTDPRVRAVAIRLLWENDDPKIARTIMSMLKEDSDPRVREAAASGLASFIYQGEIEELPGELHHAMEDALLAVLNGQDEEIIRRRALESLGFSGRAEVPPLIRKAYESGDAGWLTSSLFAMGRSADQVWEPEVKRVLQHPNAEVQFEAVRAAGELSLSSTRRILLDMLEEEAQDSDIRAAVIWSLSQIGGDEVRDTLEEILENTEDEEEIEVLENALDNLEFTEEVGIYGMIDFDQLGEPNTEIPDIEAYLNSIEADDGTWEGPKSSPDSADEDSAITKKDSEKRKRHKNSGKDQ
jgi:HEAT repeat protein